MRKSYRESFKTMHNVFDDFTDRTIYSFITRGIIDGLESPLSMGKESNVFTASSHGQRLAVKIYRLQTADFNRMYEYIRSDPRFHSLRKQRRKVIFAWCQREYKNLLVARKHGVRVPTPKAFKNNVLIMNLEGAPAPKLKDQHPKNPEEFCKKIIHEMKLLYNAKLVHGDLLAYNILNDEETPVLIDLSHSTPIDSPSSTTYLKRDCKNVTAYFKKRGVNITEEEMYEEVTKNEE